MKWDSRKEFAKQRIRLRQLMRNGGLEPRPFTRTDKVVGEPAITRNVPDREVWERFGLGDYYDAMTDKQRLLGEIQGRILQNRMRG